VRGVARGGAGVVEVAFGPTKLAAGEAQRFDSIAMSFSFTCC